MDFGLQKEISLSISDPELLEKPYGMAFGPKCFAFALDPPRPSGVSRHKDKPHGRLFLRVPPFVGHGTPYRAKAEMRGPKKVEPSPDLAQAPARTWRC